MNDPRVSAIICGAVAVWLGYTIFFSDEAPSIVLVVMQWTFFIMALAGLGAALARLMRR